MSIVYELEKKSSLVTRAFSAKSCTRDTDSLHSCTRLRLVQEMACLYHECKILPRKHSYPNLIPIFANVKRLQICQIAPYSINSPNNSLTYAQRSQTFADVRRRTQVIAEAKSDRLESFGLPKIRNSFALQSLCIR